ncbi:TetR family transcriptional regulator [Streptomyces sp. 3MP-14]|uniref:TetR family transcriptional regulator n=1 Tax=Streptomyces mimosae TaxID=2586635 RepID=A0A5N6A0Z0_9ACTN|nr:MULTISPECIES: TetR/AcrR family transcriptional regulator [Streptomyces]KAB8161659.1 TetR family transcriptional regulator [Streptomyces mimosae]KAB8173552.1 TetR family transcriptional regulator [Streptomyces sp. 3MP-14]
MAEHRAMQRAALLEAARTLLVEGGARALTFAALAERTGLARSSVYEYFSSRAALVTELCANDFPLWAAEVSAAMDAVDTPREKIAAYVRQQLALATDRRHQAVVAISASELDDAARAEIRAAHGELAELVVDVLRELGHPEPSVVAGLLRGLVDAAVGAATGGRGAHPPERIAELAVAIALDGVAGGGQPRGLGDAEDRQQPGGTPA